MTLILTRSDLEALADQAAVTSVIREALARPTTVATAPHALEVPGDDARLVPMLGYEGRTGMAALKLLVDRPSSAAEGRPSQTSTLTVTDPRTGTAVAVLHGAVPTRLRTAAVTAIATDTLAVRGADVLGLVGAGNLAVGSVVALTELRAVREVRVWSRSEATVERFRQRLATALPDGPRVVVEADAERVVRAAPMVISVTPSVEPVIHGAWLAAGQHVTAVGARPRPDERELDTAAMHAADVLVVDDRGSVTAESGDHLLARDPQTDTLPRIDAQLTDVLSGDHPGRTTAEQRTIFNGIGCGSQDAAVSTWLIDAARVHGRGVEVDLGA